MLNIKAIIRDYSPFINKQGKVNIKIRFRHKGEYIYLPTEYYIEKDQFDKKAGLLNDKHPNYQNWNLQLKYLLLEIEGKLVALGSRRSFMTKGAIINYLRSDNLKGLNFLKYFEDHIETLKKTGRGRTSYIYQAALNHLRKFKTYGTLEFKDVSTQFLYKFENFLRMKDLKINSIANLMSTIRTVYNRAIDEELVGLEHYPFRRYNIKWEITIKRNLSVDEMRKIIKAKLSPRLSEYRDFFILSFYLVGINIIDLLYLKEIDDGRIVYRRAKTKKIYSVRVYPEALEIINKYPGKEYLLKFIENYRYGYFKDILNKNLKSVAKVCNISRPLTFYYARHSWATIASSLDIPRDVIAHALGHGQSTVTDIYIDFDLKKVDIANRSVIDAIISYSG